MRDPWDEDLSILSTENVNFAVETAGLGSRFAAAVIDLTLQGLAMALLAIAFYSVTSYLPPMNLWRRWVMALGVAILGLVFFVIIWGYYFLFEWLWDGQTPGKRWLGLRVMQTSGMPITVWSALTRNLLRIADFLPLFYGMGALAAIVNPHNRRVGDLIAGTIVARERHDAARQVLSISDAADNFLAQAGAAVSAATGLHELTAPSTPTPAAPTPATLTPSTPHAPESTFRPPTAAPNATADAAVDADAARFLLRLDEQDYELTRDFLTRRDKLSASARQRLAYSLALRLCRKLNEPLPPTVAHEAFLEHAATVLQRGRHASAAEARL